MSPRCGNNGKGTWSSTLTLWDILLGRLFLSTVHLANLDAGCYGLESRFGVSVRKMAPRCDMVVKKLISSGLIYFYLTPNIYSSITKSHFLPFYWAKTARGHFFCTYPLVLLNMANFFLYLENRGRLSNCCVNCKRVYNMVQGRRFRWKILRGSENLSPGDPPPVHI